MVALQTFTGYNPNFISVIAFNMGHNKLWEAGQYHCASYLRGRGIMTESD